MLQLVRWGGCNFSPLLGQGRGSSSPRPIKAESQAENAANGPSGEELAGPLQPRPRRTTEFKDTVFDVPLGSCPANSQGPLGSPSQNKFPKSEGPVFLGGHLDTSVAET